MHDQAWLEKIVIRPFIKTISGGVQQCISHAGASLPVLGPQFRLRSVEVTTWPHACARVHVVLLTLLTPKFISGNTVFKWPLLHVFQRHQSTCFEHEWSHIWTIIIRHFRCRENLPEFFRNETETLLNRYTWIDQHYIEPAYALFLNSAKPSLYHSGTVEFAYELGALAHSFLR